MHFRNGSNSQITLDCGRSDLLRSVTEPPATEGGRTYLEAVNQGGGMNNVESVGFELRTSWRNRARHTRIACCLALAVFSVVGCVSKPVYTTEGIDLSTSPQDAQITIDFAVPVKGGSAESVKHGTIKVVAPYRNENDHFVRYFEPGNEGSEIISTFEITNTPTLYLTG